MDLIYLTLLAAFAATTYALLVLCERLREVKR
jgi:hypothetical protein